MTTTLSKKGRGRPLSFNRETLLETVMHKFWEEGYGAVSINELAKETGLTRASLYNSFQSKEALFFESLHHYNQTTPDRKLDNLPQGASISQALYQLFAELSRLRSSDARNKGCMVVNCLNELAHSYPEIAKKVADMFNSRKSAMRTLLKRAVIMGELPENTNIDQKTDMLMTFLCGFSTFAKTGVSYQEMIDLSYGFLQQIGFPPPKIEPAES